MITPPICSCHKRLLLRPHRHPLVQGLQLLDNCHSGQTHSPHLRLGWRLNNKMAGLLLVLLPAGISNIVRIGVLLVGVFCARTIVTGIAHSVICTISLLHQLHLSHSLSIGPGL